jgi:hypothetical protein
VCLSVCVCEFVCVYACAACVRVCVCVCTMNRRQRTKLKALAVAPVSAVPPQIRLPRKRRMEHVYVARCTKGLHVARHVACCTLHGGLHTTWHVARGMARAGTLHDRCTGASTATTAGRSFAKAFVAGVAGTTLCVLSGTQRYSAILHGT